MTKRGLVIFVGATGSGKSTSLAAMVDYRNEHSYGHIITIEDPVEFVHPHKNCIVTQREVGIDTDGWEAALKNTLRQAPDVILMGEIRDRETMEHAVAFAETGHLCLATLHANSANQALDRIINFFPEERRAQLLMDLSLNLEGAGHPAPDAAAGRQGRVAAVEILLNTPLIADMIFKGEVNEIKELMKRTRELGMQTFDQSLFDLYEAKPDQLRGRAAQRRHGQRPAPEDQAAQRARAQHRPVGRDRAHEDGVSHCARSSVDGPEGAVILSRRSKQYEPARRGGRLPRPGRDGPSDGRSPARAGHRRHRLQPHGRARPGHGSTEYGGRARRRRARRRRTPTRVRLRRQRRRPARGRAR